MSTHLHSPGKLLLTGEYAVLDGALALALPTRYGQSMHVKVQDPGGLRWTSYDQDDSIWFQAIFTGPNLDISTVSVGPPSIAETLGRILREAMAMNPNTHLDARGFEVETRLEFPRNWGLGSSSTLINNIAQWLEVDAYRLLWNSFGGSGYDIACAQNDGPITFQRRKSHPEVNQVAFKPPFANQLFFVHLGRKQDSRQGIATYEGRRVDKGELVQAITAITKEIVKSRTISDFEELLRQHEILISRALGLTRVRERLFPDYTGTLKSLGAWGGDFVLATGSNDPKPYFRSKGFATVIPFQEMVL